MICYKCWVDNSEGGGRGSTLYYIYNIYAIWKNLLNWAPESILNFLIALRLSVSFPNLSVWFLFFTSYLIRTRLCICNYLSSTPSHHEGALHSIRGYRPYQYQWAPPIATHTHTRARASMHGFSFPRQKKKQQLIYLQLCEGVRGVCVWGGLGVGLAESGTCVCVCACCLSWVETGVSLSETECSGFPQRTILLSVSRSSAAAACSSAPSPAEQRGAAGKSYTHSCTGPRFCFAALKNRPELRFHVCSNPTVFKAVMMG